MAPILDTLIAFDVFNGGIAGQTSTQIKDRMVIAVSQHPMPTTIWAGRNNAQDPVTVKADVATMVGALATTRYVVLGIPPSIDYEEQLGGANHAEFTTLNADLAATYGAKFIDVKALLQAHGDGSAGDNADIAADLTPRSLRQGTLHLNTAGYTIVATEVKAVMALQ